MSILYVLIPLAVLLLAFAVWALVWAIRTGQFDDLESHAWSVVLDDDQKPPGDPGDSSGVDPISASVDRVSSDTRTRTGISSLPSRIEPPGTPSRR